MELQNVLNSISDKVAGSASVKRVFGEPITTEGKTVIPVAAIGYGFGAGGGSGEGKGEGGGAGGGAGARPLGVVEITAQQTRFIPFGQTRALAAAFGLGIIFGIMLARRRRK